jgi:hypothetical protein
MQSMITFVMFRFKPKINHKYLDVLFISELVFETGLTKKFWHQRKSENYEYTKDKL